MRKTIDLPDELGMALEEMSNTLSITQTALLSIGGYQIVSRYKTQGIGMFDRDGNDGIILIESRLPSDNIAYVQNNLSSFGNVRKVKIFGNDVPNKYRVPFIQGAVTAMVEYSLIVEDDRGRQWWFAGCSCGHFREEAHATHAILTILGVPFSWQRLSTEESIEENVETDHSLILSITDFQSTDPFMRYQIDFETAHDRTLFLGELYWLGYQSNLPFHKDLWAESRNVTIMLYQQYVRNDTFLESYLKNTIFRVVTTQFKGSIKEVC